LKKKAIVDANLNRAGEGLRVVEDWARFYLRNTEITGGLREIRHGLWKAAQKNYPDIITGRNSGEDILSGSREPARECEKSIPAASFNRVKEALRVLEEMGKLVGGDASAKFKEMRFKIYEIEKDFYEKNKDT